MGISASEFELAPVHKALENAIANRWRDFVSQSSGFTGGARKARNRTHLLIDHAMDCDPNPTRPLNLVYTVNRAFISFALVSVCSVLRNRQGPIQFHIVHDADLDAHVQARIRALIDSCGSSVEFHSVPESFPREISEHSDWDVSAFYRLALPQILPPSIDRVIYLDSDTLVERCLDELADLPLGDSGLAAVSEPHDATKRLGLPPRSEYLNSGVLVIDLNVWRRRGTTAKLLDLLMQQPERWLFADQDVLAVHFVDGWTRLAPEYNCTHRFFFGDNRLPLPSANPFIIHFSGQGLKPWQTHRYHPYSDAFWQLAEQVHDAGFELPDRPRKPARWYQRGPLGVLRRRRRRRRELRRQTERAEQWARRQRLRAADREMVQNFAPEMIVKRGPFAGLRYPQAYSHGSTLAPKILGVYEAELQPTMQRLLRKDYRLIFDVGGAEGYYAIGCAMRWPAARVVAYELLREARDAIAEMAAANGVGDRLTIAAECLPADLYGRRGLVICDIEGCEAELLTHPNAEAAFAASDFIIETHDQFRPGVTAALREQFTKTHEITTVDAVPDDQRPAHWSVPELRGLSKARQARIIGERRGGPMQWLVCESRRPFEQRQDSASRAA